MNAVYVWGIARGYGGEVVLRIEDHDRLRCRGEYETAILDDLEWLGFVADVAPIDSFRTQRTGHPFRQSDNDNRYINALNTLENFGLVYPCECTRRTIAAVVPHAMGEEPRYPATCRHRDVNPHRTLARRVQVPGGDVSFDDLRLGVMTHDPSQQCGDLLARDARGYWTYQFAVTVDDMAHGVDVVIRGEDLLASTARQWRLAQLLGRELPPTVLHHPLLVHPDGAKLSKANHDRSLRERRAAGDTPEQLIGEAAYLAGVTRIPGAVRASEVGSLFRTV